MRALVHLPQFLAILLAQATPFVGNTQNLVPNGDFEAYDDCSFSTQPYISADSWVSPICWTGFTYHNTCVPTNIPLNPWAVYAAPQNYSGYQLPSSGNGYASLSLYILATGRSIYPTIELSSALQPGIEYCLSMMISLADSSNYRVNTFHGLFTHVQPNLCVIGRDSLWDDMAQIVFDISALDTSNWSLLQGSFIASGGERYLTLGNFFSPFEVLSDTVELGTDFTWEVAYYYVDDVSLAACDVGIEALNEATGVELFPNSVSGSTYLKVDDPAQWYGYQLLSASGRLLGEQSITSSMTTIPLQGITAGAYVLTLQGERTRRQVRFIVVE